jgi:hypothetical protein
MQLCVGEIKADTKRTASHPSNHPRFWWIPEDVRGNCVEKTAAQKRYNGIFE